MKRLTIILDESDHFKFKMAAHRRKKTMTAILEKRIQEVIKQEEEYAKRLGETT